jgi:signal transduction histidine kinase
MNQNYLKILENILDRLNTLNYAEQSLDFLPELFQKHLPIANNIVFYINKDKSAFRPYFNRIGPGASLNPVSEQSFLVTHLKNIRQPILMPREKAAKVQVFKKSDPELFRSIRIDLVIPLISRGILDGFVIIQANKKTFREIEPIKIFFTILSHILVPQITYERTRIDESRNYYRIYRMDRLALVGELAASAAHEIKNPLAGISTYIKYFMEKKDLSRLDFMNELKIMKESIQRIDHIVKSLLSFSKHEKKKISEIDLSEMTDDVIQSIALKIPKSIKLTKTLGQPMAVKTDIQRIQQVLINILFNALDAVGKEKGEIKISTYITGRDQVPENELFNISVIDSGPGIEESFKEKLFQPFQTTKEEGTGLGLYTCYGLMKSLGGDITINSSPRGTEVILSLPQSFEEDEEA